MYLTLVIDFYPFYAQLSDDMSNLSIKNKFQGQNVNDIVMLLKNVPMLKSNANFHLRIKTKHMKLAQMQM